MILGIDQSTSATKAMLFQKNGALLDQYSLPHQQIYPKPGWVEHDAEEIYRNVIQAVSNLIDQNPEIQDELICLSITNQRETIVVFTSTLSLILELIKDSISLTSTWVRGAK